MTDNIISANQLFFKYGGHTVLDNVSFLVKKGEFVAIIGSNGSGKSTLIKLLLKELTLGSGTITVLGENISTQKNIKNIGYVPQNGMSGFSGFPATVYELVLNSVCAESGLFSLPKSTNRLKVYSALEKVGMKEYANRLIGKLSGGQQQRVMIACAIAGKPSLLVLDEPTTGMDSASCDSLYKLLLKLKLTGLTILMVTHDVVRATGYIDRALCLEEGTLVELDSQALMHELAGRHKHPH